VIVVLVVTVVRVVAVPVVVVPATLPAAAAPTEEGVFEAGEGKHARGCGCMHERRLTDSRTHTHTHTTPRLTGDLAGDGAGDDTDEQGEGKRARERDDDLVGAREDPLRARDGRQFNRDGPQHLLRVEHVVAGFDRLLRVRWARGRLAGLVWRVRGHIEIWAARCRYACQIHMKRRLCN
jgi:hypothetical protein